MMMLLSFQAAIVALAEYPHTLQVDFEKMTRSMLDLVGCLFERVRERKKERGFNEV
jgi:hypothetical protein